MRLGATAWSAIVILEWMKRLPVITIVRKHVHGNRMQSADLALVAGIHSLAATKILWDGKERMEYLWKVFSSSEVVLM